MRERPIGGFELYAWFFTRVSGVLLLLFVLGHFAFMHIINQVEEINYDFVAARYRSPFWRMYDLAMLFLALLHGGNGLRTVIDDYARSQGWRMFWTRVVYVVGFVLLTIGSVTALTFAAK